MPEKLRRTIESVHGDQGRVWLDRLPDILTELEQRWNIEVERPYTNLSFNLVLEVRTQDDEPCVLKLGVPDRGWMAEMHALRCFDGRGCVGLLASDEQVGAMLLKRIVPGTPLSQVGDDAQAAAAFAEVAARLHRPAPEQLQFPTVADWALGFNRLRDHFGGGTGPLAERLVSKAQALFAELWDSAAELVLLHGDLHHDNILAAGGGEWIAIDPKGVIGPRAYEPTAFLRNYLLERANPVAALERRVEVICDRLGLDRQQVLQWGFAQCVLSAWWTIEDGVGGWERDIRCAELFEQLLG